MAEAAASLVLRAIEVAIKWYKKDGTAHGLRKQTEKVLAKIEALLSVSSIDEEEWERIEEAVALHPGLQSREKLLKRLRE